MALFQMSLVIEFQARGLRLGETLRNIVWRSMASKRRLLNEGDVPKKPDVFQISNLHTMNGTNEALLSPYFQVKLDFQGTGQSYRLHKSGQRSHEVVQDVFRHPTSIRNYHESSCLVPHGARVRNKIHSSSNWLPRKFRMMRWRNCIAFRWSQSQFGMAILSIKAWRKET
jgi:hypothetical protein